MTTIDFRAPWSRALRRFTTGSVVTLALLMVAALLLPAAPPLAVVILLLALPPLIIAGALAYAVRGYTLTEDAVIVRRRIADLRLPLAGLKSVSGDADAMKGAWRVLGNSGLFAITGRYWNRKLGWYRAYATDPERAVVLRYPDRTVVITPHDPQQFIMRAGTLIRLTGKSFRD